MAKNTRHSELVSETNKGGESLPLARTSLLATPSSGGPPRNAPDLPLGFDFANAKSITF